MTHDSQYGEQLSSNSISLQSGFHEDAEAVSTLQHTDFTSVFPSNKFVHDSYHQDQISSDNDDNADKSGYIITIATVRRDLLDKSELSVSRTIHKCVLDKSIITVAGIDRLSILVDLGVKHEILLHDGFSETKQWGRLHHFYVKVIGSQIVAYGIAALLGTLFKQNAIGIIHPLTKSDRQSLSSNQGQPLLKDFHPYFTVHSTSPISRDTAIEAMKNVCQCFSEISAQLDVSGRSIEFHDFGSSSHCTKENIKNILNEKSNQTFQVSINYAKSYLLNKSDYQQALVKMGLEMSRSINWEELISKYKIPFV